MKTARIVSVFFLALAVFAFKPSKEVVSAQQQKLSPFLVKKLTGDGVRNLPVLVTLTEQANTEAARALETKEARGRFVYDTLRKTALQTQGDLTAFLDSRGVTYQRFYIVNMIALDSATPELIEELAAREDVGHIAVNSLVPLDVRPHQPMLDGDEPGDNIASVGAPQVWDMGFRGQNIVVANQDTGVKWDLPELRAHYRGVNGNEVNHNYNWHDAIHKAIAPGANPCGYDSKEPCDDQEHGTHTMGTIVGGDGTTVKIGMAPGAQWISCHNMDQGVGMPSTYIECFEFLLAPYPIGGNAMTDGDPTKAPHVISNSWGCPPSEGCEGSEILPAVKALYNAGVVVVASAGNDGPDCSTIHAPPAHYSDYVISVGAYDHRNGQIAFFSSHGPSAFDQKMGPDVSAPGVGVSSIVPQGVLVGMSGTSMAGPHVAGEVALILSAKPQLIGKIDQIKELITSTAEGKQAAAETCGGVSGTQIPNNTYGHGNINALNAVKKALSGF